MVRLGRFDRSVLDSGGIGKDRLRRRRRRRSIPIILGRRTARPRRHRSDLEELRLAGGGRRRDRLADRVLHPGVPALHQLRGAVLEGRARSALDARREDPGGAGRLQRGTGPDDAVRHPRLSFLLPAVGVGGLRVQRKAKPPNPLRVRAGRIQEKEPHSVYELADGSDGFVARDPDLCRNESHGSVGRLARQVWDLALHFQRHHFHRWNVLWNDKYNCTDGSLDTEQSKE
mmetsp:Transcript_4181/g.10852  ORF Transcript_4181/g.10852 Transcript_4181/m.10852 type:complete len:230 (+) Transcript_4181:229-918(+)